MKFMFKSQCLLIFFVLLLFLSFDGFTVTTKAKATAKALRFKDVEEEKEEEEESDVKAAISPLVTKDERKTVTQTEYGQISSVDINDHHGTKHHLQFITLEPNSLFLPVLLHADMVFYVQTGSGSLSWVDEDGNKNQFSIRRGDIYRLHSGSVFHIRSSLESKREKLRIYAIFTQNNNANENPQKLFIGAYSTLTDLVVGFDKKVLQTAFNVPEQVLEEITKADKPPAIIHLSPKGKSEQPSWKAGIIETLVGGGESYEINKKKKTTKTFNILEKKPDFENCNGWSLAVNKKDFPALKGSDIGVFMVNLTIGSMMGPHWNPRASEIAIVTHGQGMIRVVCSSISNETSSGCKNVRFRVKEGDVFVVPRFHPMAQMSYNNDSLVFMGFTTMAKTNHPQFLAGESSVLRTLDRDILAMSFNVPNTTIDRLLGSQVESIILECVSCAEEEEKTMQKEIEKEREEEERKRKEEEEEEERRKEKERRQQEEEARRRQEEKAKREEEEAKRQEEERQAREKREEEERKRRREEEEEEAERRERERAEKEAKEEEEKRREEEEAQRREEEEAEERKRREEEEETERREEEEEAERRKEEERAEEEERERGGGGKGRRILKKMWKV